ncbi:MAG: hypothetical protein IT375_21270 [Polyangiaceae bacterium]|nr:hypothetical protein [Polyangiaceae bacterium]
MVLGERRRRSVIVKLLELAIALSVLLLPATALALTRASVVENASALAARNAKTRVRGFELAPAKIASGFELSSARNASGKSARERGEGVRVHHRNRIWDPGLGAFLSPDEFEFVTSGTLWNWPGQSPLRYRDRTGQFGDETVVLMHHPEPVPAGLPPGPPSGVFVGLGGGATFTGSVAVGAGKFFGAATPDATYGSIGIGVGFLPAAGAGVQAGWFAGTAEEFGRAQTLFLGVGTGVGVEGALIFGPNGSFGASLSPQLVMGSPLWGGTILGGESSVVCE